MALNTIPAAASLRYNLVYFSSTTTYTIPSTSIGYIDIWAVGPGAGGGRPSTSGTTVGTGGGPGQLIYNSDVAVTAGATLTITIPSGGSGSTSNDTSAADPTTETTISGIANGGTIIAVAGKGGQRTTGNGISSPTQKGTFQFPSSSSAAFGISPTGFSYSATNGTASNGGNGKQIFSQIPKVTTAVDFSMSISPTAELLTNFPVTYLHSSAGTSGTNGSTSNGGSSTSTTYFAGQGGTGGLGATAGGTGVGGGGGGGGAGTTGGAGGNGSANSGSGGGGGGGSSSTSGSGGNGGSGFVIIQGWW